MRRIKILFSTAVLLVTGALQATADEPPSRNPGSSPDAPSNVLESFEVEGNGDLLLIPVTIHGRNYPFIVDTGCSVSVFDTSLKGMLRPTGKRNSLNDKTSVEVMECTDATVGASRLPLGKQCISLDLGELRRGSGLDIQGMLGMNFLENYTVEINFDAGRLAFLKSAEQASGTRVALKFDSKGTPTVAVDLPSVGKAPFLIDTGLSGFDSGDLRPQIFDKMVRRSGEAAAGGTPSIVVGEPMGLVRSVTVERISLGGIEHTGESFSEGRRDLLSLWYLSRYNLTFDFPRKWLFLEKGKNFAKRFAYNESGVYIEPLDGNLIVGWIVEDGFGYASGLRKGDRLLRINGDDAQQRKLYASRLLFRSPPDELRLEVIGEHETNPRELRLRRRSTPAAVGGSSRPAVK